MYVSVDNMVSVTLMISVTQKHEWSHLEGLELVGVQTERSVSIMPPSDTICISLGNWIVAFYVVYAMAAVALVSASAVLVDWSVGMAKRSRLAGKGKLSRGSRSSSHKRSRYCRLRVVIAPASRRRSCRSGSALE